MTIGRVVRPGATRNRLSSRLPNEVTKPNSAPATMPGRIAGTVMRQKVTQAVAPLPVNILSPGLPVATLAGLGARRISLGAGLALTAYRAAFAAAQQIAEHGTFAPAAGGPALNPIFAGR